MVSPCACTIAAYVGLGSNMGDSADTIREAVRQLRMLDGPRVDAVSPLYETEPQGHKEQNWFCNGVVRLLCPPEMTPTALLRELLRIEAAMGRERSQHAVRFGPRPIDLDLLLYGEMTLETEELTLPHPRMRERAFVLVPLRDLAPELVFPDGETLTRAIAKLTFHVHNHRIEQP